LEVRVDTTFITICEKLKGVFGRRDGFLLLPFHKEIADFTEFTRVVGREDRFRG
jgi:hypothetical protein